MCLFPETFFVTKEAKINQYFICMHVFLLEKSYIKVYTRKSTSDFMAAIKKCAKEIGAPEILVANIHPYQKSKDVKNSCNQIGTTIHILDQET